MQIKRWLQLNVVVSVLTAVFICLMLFIVLHRVTRAIAASNIANEIVMSAFERSMFREDFLRTNSERARVQWFAKHEQISTLLKTAAQQFEAAEDKENVGNLIKDHESLGKLFSAIVANRVTAGADANSAALAREIENRLHTQLIMRLYDSTLLAHNLQESGNRSLFAVMRLAGGGTISVLVLVIAVAVLNSWAMNRAITARIERLREGASVIGGGNLDYSIDVTGDDEFADLSEAFNTMTAKLRGSYRELEREIVERKQVEEALRESEEKLSLALLSAGMGVWRLDLNEQKRYFDNQVCRCLGIDPARFDGTAEEFYVAVHPDDCDGLKAALDGTIKSDSPYEVEYRAVWPDGCTRHIAARGRLTRDAAGQAQWVDGLAWDVTERRQAEERLKTSLHEKEVLLKEVHHRVKNNLQIISSLVNLQADTIDNPNVRGLFREVRDRVRSMALVHEKLYQSEDLALVPFDEYAKSLLNYLWRAFGNAEASIRLSLELQPVLLSVEKAVPCGLILNELVTNALKHAFPGRSEGEVTTSLNCAPDGSVCLRVSDDGVGISPDLDWQQSSSLGLRLVQMLAEQLDATVELNSGRGTEFQITFKLQEAVKDGERKHE